jgi:hypothetical protein
MHLTEGEKAPGALKDVSADNIAYRVNQIEASSASELLEKWLGDNQVELPRVELISGHLHAFIRQHFSTITEEQRTQLHGLMKELNGITGCLHPADGLEVGKDEIGVHVLCSRCPKITRDLKTWE